MRMTWTIGDVPKCNAVKSGDGVDHFPSIRIKHCAKIPHKPGRGVRYLSRNIFMLLSDILLS